MAFDPENQASYAGGISDPHSVPVRPLVLSSVKAVVALASLKGGTGKSAIAVSLACALAQAGKRVAILDADLKTPSTLAMLGVKAPVMLYASEAIEPASGPLGIRVLSGEFIPDNNASALSFADEQVEPVPEAEPESEPTDTLHRLLSQSRLGSLDVLIIDLATGIEPIHELLEFVPSAGIVIVSQPSALNARALRGAIKADATLRGAAMGVIENLVGFNCDICRSVRPLLPEGEVPRTARELNLPMIARLPFDPRFAEATDRGRIFLSEFPETPMAKQIAAMAKGVESVVNAKIRAAIAARQPR